MMKIILLGLKGVGKTSLGEKLAALLNLPFIDTDNEIERSFGRKPRLILQEDGEIKLREMEDHVIKDLKFVGDSVIAVGGGSFLSSENQEVLKTLGTLICLHLSKKKLLERWDGWPVICKSIEKFDNYYENRIQKLRELPCVWVDASRLDLLDLVMRVVDGK